MTVLSGSLEAMPESYRGMTWHMDLELGTPVLLKFGTKENTVDPLTKYPTVMATQVERAAPAKKMRDL